jgi:uncharacterized membrane protein
MEVRDRNRTIAISVMTVALLALAVFAVLRLGYLIEIPLVLYLPGHAILRAAGPRSLTGFDRVLFAFALSLVIVIIGGFLLHMIGFMTPAAWAVYLISAISIAWASAKKPKERPPSENRWATLTAADGVMLASAAFLAIGALMIDRREATAHSEFKYSEFWIVPQNAQAPNPLTIGIRNKEGKPSTYEVEFMVDGQISGRTAVRLQPDEVWTSEIDVGVKAGRVERVEAWLFKDGDHRTVYRRVWADIGRASKGAL